jgi:hypothetical protein
MRGRGRETASLDFLNINLDAHFTCLNQGSRMHGLSFFIGESEELLSALVGKVTRATETLRARLIRFMLYSSFSYMVAQPVRKYMVAQ